MAGVEVVEHGNGDTSIGVVFDGTFVPFATVTKARVTQLQERAASLTERAESGDEEDKRRVAEAVASYPTSTKSPSKSSTSTKSEGGAS